jgi:hypothetical protein
VRTRDMAPLVRALVKEILDDADFEIMLPIGDLTIRPTTPEEINFGGCGEFSDRLLQKLRDLGVYDASPVDSGDVGKGLEEGEHVWTYWRGRHYDSEAPEGVEDWRELPFFAGRRQPPRLKESAAIQRQRLDAGCEASVKVWRSIRKHQETKARGECPACPVSS